MSEDFVTLPQHATKDGRIEEVKLRHLGAADGGTVIAKNVRLGTCLRISMFSVHRTCDSLLSRLQFYNVVYRREPLTDSSLHRLSDFLSNLDFGR